MKLLSVVTSSYIYHGCSTRKTFWEENFTDKEDLFLCVNMKNCGRRKVRKHKEIKGSDKYVTLDIKVWQSEQDGNHIFRVKRKIGKIRKWVGYRSGFQDQSRVHKSTKRQGMPLEMSVRKTFWRLSKILRNWQNNLWEEEAQTWAYSQLLSSSKATCEGYDEIW